MKTDGFLFRPLELAHLAVAGVVKPGDCVVDATMGNGHDTEFLARLVGDSGRVVGFDVQENALTETVKRLSVAGISRECVDCHLCSHVEMAKYVQEPPVAVMFNLGYLPGGDKSITTKTSETLAALNSACSLLKQNGILTVMCYPGHQEGMEEGRQVESFFQSLPIREWLVTKVFSLNGRQEAPFLLAAVKK